MRISLDLGYGYVKGINERLEKILYPSVVGEGFERRIEPFGKSGAKYDVTVNNKRYFAGELAVREIWNAARAFDGHRVQHYSTPVLLALSAALLTKPEDAIHLATGLPLEIYKTQKTEMKALAESLRASVTVHGFSGPREVRFESVVIYPQACGAFYAYLLTPDGSVTGPGRALLEEGGVVGLVDVGYKTTDYVLFDLSSMEFIESMSGTLSMGLSDVYRELQAHLQSKTGEVIDTLRVEEAVRQGRIWINGVEHLVSWTFGEIAAGFAGRIADALQAAWRDRTKYLRLILCAGGGAEHIDSVFLRRGFTSHVVEDPQFANARGFLALMASRGG